MTEQSPRRRAKRYARNIAGGTVAAVTLTGLALYLGAVKALDVAAEAFRRGEA